MIISLPLRSIIFRIYLLEKYNTSKKSLGSLISLKASMLQIRSGFIRSRLSQRPINRNYFYWSSDQIRSDQMLFSSLSCIRHSNFSGIGKRKSDRYCAFLPDCISTSTTSTLRLNSSSDCNLDSCNQLLFM